MRVLVDADIFRYQHGSIEMAHPFLEGEKIPAAAEYICDLVDETIKSIISSTNADSYICALSGKGNFRNEIAKQQVYKGNRDPNLTRPHHYDTVTQHIINNHPHIVVDGIEADDWLGIEQRKDPENTCISSRDKDLKGVYGYHHRFPCGEKQPEVPMHWMTEFESAHFFFYQMLIGDNTDNIGGCGVKVETKWGKNEDGSPKYQMRRKGVGPAAAIKLLASCTTVENMYSVIKQEYEKVFNDSHEEVMLENARLLYIGQSVDNLFTWDWLDMNLSCEKINEAIYD